MQHPMYPTVLANFLVPIRSDFISITPFLPLCTVKTAHTFYFIAVPAQPPHIAECSIHCPQLFQPICASNGETFNNACELEVANCKGQI